MSSPHEVNSCNAIDYPIRQILKPQTGTQIYDCKVFFFATSRKFETSQGEVCWDSGTNLSVLDPLQTSCQFMQLNVPLFPASEKVLIGKAH